MSSMPPPLTHVLETCLYVRCMDECVKFYEETFNIDPFLKSPRVSAFALGSTTLLLFQIGGTADDVHLPTGVIPGHGPTSQLTNTLLHQTSQASPDNSNATGDEPQSLRQHFCLSVPRPEDVSKWDEHLQKLCVKIRGRMEWERGGRSVYFEDLEGNVGEIGSRGIWAHYPIE